MSLVKIKKNYQITIPRSLRQKIRLAVGDYVEIDNQDDCITIKPVKVIDPGQEYFYTKEWQEKETEADKEITKGETLGPFDNAKDALKALKKAKI